MSIYLPLAEESYNIFVLLFIGLTGGFFSGFFGIGGGFITSPILIAYGIPPTIAIASQASQITSSSISAGLSYWVKKQVDLRMAFLLVISGIVGVLSGVFLLHYLLEIGLADFAISVSLIFVLSIVSGSTIIEYIHLFRSRLKGVARRKKLHLHIWVHALPGKVRFRSSLLYISIWLPLCVGGIVGLFVGLLGVGGGFILIPALVYLIGMPTLLAIGTSFAQIIVLSMIATISHAYINTTVDVVLSFFLITGSVVGAIFGSRLAFIIRVEVLRILFSLLLLSGSIFIAYQLFVPPDINSSDLFHLVFIP